MPDEVTTVMQHALRWARDAHDTGWLGEQELHRFTILDQKSPADLFNDRQIRPLVAGLFGGTGTGKSSLLNRLAGSPIARTGVTRPTSIEVTLYLHEAIGLANLPDEFPAELTRIERHNDDERHDIVWLDMPDIDSARTENRELAMSWLGHIDLLIYVVSPERYRDDRGWQVLRERGHRHGWLFVMNRWDEGQPQQIDDFTAILREAGFADPVVLRTSCAPDATAADEFARIEETIRAALQDHGVRELERLGLLARLHDTGEALASTQSRLGSANHWEVLKLDARERWQLTKDDALDNLAWSIKHASERFEDQPDSVDRVLNRVSALTASGQSSSASRNDDDATANTENIAQQPESLWDHWLQSKLVAAFNTTEIAVSSAHLAAGPLRQRLAGIADTAPTTIEDRTQQILRSALAKPGNVVQRALQQVLKALRAILPLLALIWVAWTVVTRFYLGVTGEGEFLGTPFAINSAMLVLSAWGVPWILERLLRPSVKNTAANGLRRGLGEGVDLVGQQLESAFDAINAERHALVERREQIARQIQSLSETGPLSRSVSRLVATENQ